MLTCGAIDIASQCASRQTKISDFDKFVVTDQHIASGEIPMNDALC